MNKHDYRKLDSFCQAADILNAPWWTFVLGGLSRVLAITVHLGFATLIVLVLIVRVRRTEADLALILR